MHACVVPGRQLFTLEKVSIAEGASPLENAYGGRRQSVWRRCWCMVFPKLLDAGRILGRLLIGRVQGHNEELMKQPLLEVGSDCFWRHVPGLLVVQ